MNSPKAFISYTWESESHKSWVRSLAIKLRLDGIEVLLDQWELAPGDQLPAFMEKSIRESDFVLIVCTPAYKRKADQRVGGVGYEGDVITAELATGIERRKFIPILKGQKWNESAPSYLLGTYYIDLRQEPFDESNYEDLINTLNKEREKAPPIGRRNSKSRKMTKAHKMDLKPAKSNSIKQPSQEKSDFPFLFAKLVETNPNDPELIERGVFWLKGNMHDPGWQFVFKKITEIVPEIPEVYELARYWLKKNMHNSGWTHVWMALMNTIPNDPELTELGKIRLKYST